MRCATRSRRTCSTAVSISGRSRRLLGHEKLETTARYTRVATGLITAVESPLDQLRCRTVRGKPARQAQAHGRHGGVAAADHVTARSGGRGHLPRSWRCLA